MIKENLEVVHENIRKACEKAGRDLSEVTLVCVSKTKPESDILEAYDLGERIFGENHVQEIVQKSADIDRPGLCFHMIGHLQTNKVRQIVDKVSLIHSVDSLKLAKEISKEAVKRGITVPVLLEINIAGEESKYGIAPEETGALAETIASLPGVKIEGLMTVAPITENAEENRVYFRKMKQLSVDIKGKNIDNVSMNVLSMGMTGDYTVAIEEGATHVRIGTGIFGKRNYDL